MPSTNGTNGTTTYAFPPGIHVPSLTWFKNDYKQEIDWDVQQKHFEFLIPSGLHGIVIAGTNGEAATLSSFEEGQLVQKARKTTSALGRGHLPITLGGVAGCTRDAIQQTVETKEAGASYYLALVPSYFHFAMGQDAIVAYFQELADASPIPVVLYNFSNVVAGLDINSEMLDILGKHKNIVAVKLTCGGIAKVARISAAFDKSEFVALAGHSDWFVPALSVGGVGTIISVANLYPKVCTYCLHCQVQREANRLVMLTHVRPLPIRESTPKRQPSKSNFPSLNGASERAVSMAQNMSLRIRGDTRRAVQTAGGRTRGIRMRKRGNGW
jgi:4-hydroxy-2-oxoglutarate aldolase